MPQSGGRSVSHCCSTLWVEKPVDGFMCWKSYSKVQLRSADSNPPCFLDPFRNHPEKDRRHLSPDLKCFLNVSDIAAQSHAPYSLSALLLLVFLISFISDENIRISLKMWAYVLHQYEVVYIITRYILHCWSVCEYQQCLSEQLEELWQEDSDERHRHARTIS